ncbi:hypothetical protein TNCV_2469381 [Trichonephila clavipes]|nr:hypothetical protein TNCV_2469381 [Trichonephila clavipes]
MTVNEMLPSPQKLSSSAGITGPIGLENETSLEMRPPPSWNGVEVVIPFSVLLENVMANAFWVSVRSNISKRWNITENNVFKNQSSADSALRLPNTSILNSNAADITEYFLVVYQTALY